VDMKKIGHLLELLPEDVRERVERGLYGPRDTQLGVRCPQICMDAWKGAAERRGLSLTEWVESRLNHAVIRETIEDETAKGGAK
jgi:hypothetical protein